MAKSNCKILCYDYDDDSSNLIEHSNCCDADQSKDRLVSSPLPTKTCSMITHLKQSSFIQLLLIVTILVSFFLLLILIKLKSELLSPTSTASSINYLINDYYTVNNSKSINDNYYESLIRRQKLRHGNVMAVTHCGTLFGGKEYDAYVFKGIPYAQPPVGPRRWSPPEPLCNPETHRHCNKFGSQCFQVNPFTREYEGNEDCLYLNVWTPNIDSEADLAVMVWIHGGFLQFGSGHQPGLKPNGKLSKNTNTVYVSLNYRLHVLGFLALDILKNNTMSSTNFGIMDVVLALQWIQINIKAFGGDPRKVTLFGADSGSAIILAIISNANMRSLFHSSWLIDPAVYFDKSISSASKDNKKYFLSRTNCKSIDCLRSLPASRVISGFLGRNDPSFRIIDQNDLPILGILSEQLITIDNTIVREFYPYEAINSDIPVLIGSSAHAISFWPGPKDLSSWKWSDFAKYVSTSLDSFGPRISQMALELYLSPLTRNGYETITPQTQFISMVSELRQICPINYFAEILSISNNTNIYRYIISATTSQAIRIYETPVNYSSHLIDAIAFFGQMEAWIRWPTLNDYSISKTIQQIVCTFINAKRNNSNDDNASSSQSSSLWQSFPREIAEIVSQLNYTSIVTTNYHQSDRCSFWQSTQLFNYMWTV